jgi:hypothetical protein
VSIRSDLREGRDLGVPLCCRARFALEWALAPQREQAVRRGICFNREQIEYVPCGIFHRATLTHAEHEQLLPFR